MKKVLALLLALVMMLALVACGETDAEEEDVEDEVEAELKEEEEEDEEIEDEKDTEEEDEEESSDSSFSAKDAIKIDELDWSFSYAIVDGEQFVSFDYTNNSAYTILDFMIEMRRKDDVTDEEMLSVYGTETNEYYWDEDEIIDFYATAENRKCAEPGETVTEYPCVVNYSYVPIETMEQIDLMEPDNATIVFLGGDGYMYVIYYSFDIDTYGTDSSGGTEAVQWSDSEISSLAPEADFTAVILSRDKEDDFSFTAYDVTFEEFEDYVDAVIANGFTEDVSESSGYYRAYNEDGIKARVEYTAIEESMYVSIDGDLNGADEETEEGVPER